MKSTLRLFRLWFSLLVAPAPGAAWAAAAPAPATAAVAPASPGQPASTAPAGEFTSPGGVDEFGTLEATATAAPGHDHAAFHGEARAFHWVLGILFATVVAGLLIHFGATRNLRAVFLTASVAVLGFYKGACPCPIQSLQYLTLNLFGHAYKWQTLVYLLGLLPLAYLFGRVFCGWICHMGAVQEFLFLGNRFRFLQSERAQVIMRRVRIAALVALVAQVTITQSNLYKKIDPFAVLYNFNSATALGWGLLAVLVVASVLIHRPFCKTLCPIGLVLGWVAKIPGASVLGPSGDCLGCSSCHQACRINAITRDGRASVLDNQECIRCGECLGHCRHGGLSFRWRSRHHPDRVTLKSPALPTAATRASASPPAPVLASS
jgi:ferredoxin